MPRPASKDHYTFADCLIWGKDERIEIINGEAVMMAPPTRIHQEILMELSRQLARACLKNVNMPNRRVFCPLDGAIFPCNPPGFLRKNCLPAAQNPSLPDTSPIFKQALTFWRERSAKSVLRHLPSGCLKRTGMPRKIWTRWLSRISPWFAATASRTSTAARGRRTW